MQVTCSCGKLLSVPDTLAGRNVRCPACKKVFKAEGTVEAATPPGKVAFACACGRKLTAPVAAAGRRVSCPACNKELVIPGAAPVAASANGAPAAQNGGKQKDESDLYAVSKPHCPTCKAEMEPNAQFCIQCGTNLATGGRAIEAVAKPQEKTAISPKTRMIFIGIGAAVVIAGALGAWLVLGKGGGTTASATTPSTTNGRNGAKHARGGEGYFELLLHNLKAVQVQIDDMSVKQSVEAFKAQSGRLPKDIAELEQAGYPLPKLPDGQQYLYDPQTGEIRGCQMPAEDAK